MIFRLAIAAIFFISLLPARAAAQSSAGPLFDIIIPSEFLIRASNNSIGSTSSRYGWLIARGDTLSVFDLQNAVLTGSASDPALTGVIHSFLNIQDFAPLQPGEAAGSMFVSGVYSPLLLPGETLIAPTGSNPNLGLIDLGFNFPTSPTYTGSTFQFDGSISIRGETINYSTEVTITRANASSSSTSTNPVRLSSPTSVPEPSSAVLLGLGLIGLGLRVRSR